MTFHGLHVSKYGMEGSAVCRTLDVDIILGLQVLMALAMHQPGLADNASASLVA